MSIDSLYLDQIRKLMREAQELERSGRKEEASRIYEKVAFLYERAAEAVSLQSTREVYLKKAEEARRRSGGHVPAKAVVDKDEPDYDKVAESMIERSTVTWDDISGLEDVKSILKEAVTMATAKPEKPVRLDPPRSILLFGPPGTGKTLLASAASSSLRATFFNADASKILSKYVGEAPKTLDALFNLARRKAPSLVFVDEIDSITVNRESNQNVGAGLLQKLLTEMDGFKKGSTFVMVMGSTNRPWSLDEAVVNRFDFRVYVPPPDLEGRKSIFQLELGKKGFQVEGDYEEYARATEGYTGREISQICRKAVMYMLRRMNPDMEGARTLRIDVVRRDEIMRSIGETKPTVTKELLSKYQEWDREHGSR